MDTAYAGGAGGKQDLTCSRLASKLHRRLEGEMPAPLSVYIGEGVGGGGIQILED